MPGEHICTHLDSSTLDHAKRYYKDDDVDGGLGPAWEARSSILTLGHAFHCEKIPE